MQTHSIHCPKCNLGFNREEKAGYEEDIQCDWCGQEFRVKCKLKPVFEIEKINKPR